MSSERGLFEGAKPFFEGLEGVAEAQGVLRRYDQVIQFLVEDDEPFYVDISRGRVRVAAGEAGPRSLDQPHLLHLRTRAATLLRLFRGEIRFSDAALPTLPGKDFLILEENRFYKFRYLTWLGILFRLRQAPPCQRASSLAGTAILAGS